MNVARSKIAATIRAQLPCAQDPDCRVQEDSVLSDLGVTSLHLVSVLLVLQKEYRFDLGSVMQSGMPVTVGDLVDIIEQQLPPGRLTA